MGSTGPGLVLSGSGAVGPRYHLLFIVIYLLGGGEGGGLFYVFLFFKCHPLKVFPNSSGVVRSSFLGFLEVFRAVGDTT